MAKLPTVVIPTYNNTKGLKYLLNYFKGKPYQVVIVDNKPSPEKNGFIDSLFHGYKDKLTYLPQKDNLGFARGVNLGARGVKAKWMLILNDDIEFEVKSSSYAKASEDKQKLNSKVKSYQSNIIEELIKFAEEKNLDAVTPGLRNPDGRIENLGYRVLPIGRVELIKENYRLDPRLRGDDVGERENVNTSIDGLTAACLLIKTKVFKKLRGFDESFFAYLEDVDFFLRFKKAGYEMGIAGIEVLHNHMTTTKTMGNLKSRQDMINWWRLYFKHKEKFKFNLDFIVERVRNVSGYLKATLKKNLFTQRF